MSAFVIDDKKKRQYLVVFVVSIIISFALGFTSGYFTNLSPSSQSYDQLKSELFGDSAPANEDASQQQVPDAEQPGGDEKTDAEKADDKKESDQKEVQGKTPVKKTEAGARDAAPEKKSASARSAVAVTEPKSPERTKTTSVSRPAKKPNPKPESKQEARSEPEPKPRPVEKAKPRPKPEPPPVPEPKPEPVEQPALVQTEETPAPTRPQEEDLASTRPPVTDSEKLPVAYVPEAQTQATAGAGDNGRTSGEASRHYAVQVGMFANRDNAQKLVYELIDDGYDAYMDEFTASDGELKYNVRFGRFADRASVQSRLADYKREYASPAYIIITK